MKKIIKDYLEQRGITQNDLAQELNVDKGHFSRIRAGTRKPSIALLKKLAKKTGHSIDDLVKGV